MVRLLTRLDPQCISIREHLLSRYKADKAIVDPAETVEERKERLAELESRLKEGQHYPDYERKLYLIENCIYGVDIQPIATQISKLRFFISLLCDQLRSSFDPDAENFGLLSLPNLEAKFVCANTLISLPEQENEFEFNKKISDLRIALQENRHKIFRARSTKTKDKYKGRDLEIRDAIRESVRDSLSKPDTLLIAKFEEEIKDAKERRKKVAEPDWYEENVQVQDDFFSEFKSKRVRKDRNEAERSKIDAEIAWAEKKIKDERNKGDKANVSAAARYADMVAGWDPYDQNASSEFFDPEWMFNIKDGFDVVIGNPPYVSAVSMARGIEERRLLKQLYPLATGAYDYYILFLLRGIQLSNGGYSWIIPNKFLVAEYARQTRQYLIDSKGLQYSVDVSIFHIFESASVYPIVILGDVCNKRSDFKRYYLEKYEDLGLRKKKEVIIKEYGIKIVEAGLFVCCGAAGFEAEILKSCVRDGKCAKAIPFTVSGNIDRYTFNNINVRYMKHIFRSAYVVPNECISESRREMWMTSKIIVAGMTKGIEATYVEEPLALGVGAYAITDFSGYNPLVILGILNSRFISHFCQNTFIDKHLSGGYLALNKGTIEQIPLPVIISEDDGEQIKLCVDRILAAKKADPASDTSALEAEIDHLVYKLYGLTDEEIAVVEGRGAETAPDGTGDASERIKVAPGKPRRRSTVEAVNEDDEELE
jgi:hypothetical protein